MTSRVNTEHTVDEQQREPNLNLDEQPTLHAVDYTIVDTVVAARYAITEVVGVALQVPVRVRIVEAALIDELGNELDIDSIHHRDETVSGLGDLELDATFSTSWEEVSVRAYLGASLPTGSTEPDPFELGEQGEPHQHLFLGTGTVDPRAGVQGALHFDGFDVGLDVSGTGAVYANEHGYQRGLSVTGLVRVSSGLGVEGLHLSLEAGGRREQPSSWESEDARNSGRLDAIVGGGVTWLWTKSLSTTLSASKPFVLDVHEGALEIPFILGLNVGWRGKL